MRKPQGEAHYRHNPRKGIENSYFDHYDVLSASMRRAQVECYVLTT